jgi:hypothetical protein
MAMVKRREHDLGRTVALVLSLVVWGTDRKASHLSQVCLLVVGEGLIYAVERLVGGSARETATHESAWESNPPATLVTPPTRFEDEGCHRATSALAR